MTTTTTERPFDTPAGAQAFQDLARNGTAVSDGAEPIARCGAGWAQCCLRARELEGSGWRVTCGTCGATGQWAATEAEAVAAWNARMGAVKAAQEAAKARADDAEAAAAEANAKQPTALARLAAASAAAAEAAAEPQRITAPDMLDAAARHMRDRAATYDKPEGERSMAATVAAFNAIKGRDVLTEADGWLLMDILKIVRQEAAPGFHRDSADDHVAYAALYGEAKAREAGHG